MKRTHHVEIGHQKVEEASRSRREAPRSIWAGGMLVRAPNTTGYAPGPRKTSASTMRTRCVEIPAQEAKWVSWTNHRGRKPQKVVDSGEHARIRPKGVGDERDVETNAPSRDMPPGDPEGDQIESGGVESGRERQSEGEGDRTDGIRRCKDGATSGARRDSKRVETTPLAEGETGQYRRRTRTTTDVPRPSTAPTNDHRLPMDHPNPPRRRRRLKSRPRRVSNPRKTYQVTRARQGRIGRIGRVVHAVYGP